MRLRQLSTTQSIVYFAPPEVHTSILDACKKADDQAVHSEDVVRWLLVQTCSHIEQMYPLYVHQGLNFVQRQQALQQYSTNRKDKKSVEGLLDVLRGTEMQSLQDMYGVRQAAQKRTALEITTSKLRDIFKNLTLQQGATMSKVNQHSFSSLQEVEQEREVFFETETIRKVEKPVYHKPCSFVNLHQDIVAFVQHGTVKIGSTAFDTISNFIRGTRIGKKYQKDIFSAGGNLLISNEFSRTIEITRKQTLDTYIVS